MNRIARFLAAEPSTPEPSWGGGARLAGFLAAQARTPGDIWLALKAIFPEHDPHQPFPSHMKAGTGPEAALATLIDGLRDGLNACLEAREGGPGVRYLLDDPEA